MQNKHFRIALYIDYIDSEYIQNLIVGVKQFVAKKDMDLIIFPCGEFRNTSDSHNYQYLAAAAHITPKNVDGIIFTSGTQLHHGTPEELHSFEKSFEPLPVVSIGYTFPDIPSVMPDCTVGMSSLVNHLIKKHHCKRIALMGVTGNSEEAAERTRVYKETLEQNGIVYDPEIVLHGDFMYDGAQRALEEYAEKNPKLNLDAIVALNDVMAYACIDFLHNHKVNVPQDVIVTGFDDLTRSSYISPTLTSVNQSIEEQGFAAAEMLYEILNKHHPVMYNAVPSKAFFRQSCGCVLKRNTEGLALDENGNKISLFSKNGFSGVAEWCEKSSQFVHAIHVYSRMQNDSPLDVYRKFIEQQFNMIDVNAAAICFYKTPVSTDRFEFFPLPSEAYLLAAFDNTTGYHLDVTKPVPMFNPNDGLLPKSVVTSMNGMFVMALFRNSVQYGYIVFRPGHYDMIVYNMIIQMFGNSLASSYNVSCAENARKALEREYDIASQISLTDEMTGLLNRRGFVSLGQKTLEVSEAINQSGMVLYGDMAGLKKINDTYGHAAGDRAIKAEAKLLKKEFRSVDIIGRLGGDEFAIVAPSMNEKKFEALKKRLYDNCAEWNKKSGEKFTLSISLGYAPFTPELQMYNIKTLLEFADKSLYEEKNRKKTGRKSKK